MKKERVQKIVNKVKARCKKLGVKLVLDNKHEFLDNEIFSEASAYFTEFPIPLIKVSTYRRLPEVWLPNLLHELSHAEQWYAATPEWQACVIDGVDVTEIIDLWVNGVVEMTVDQRRTVFKRLQYLEYFAEVETVRKIKKYKLDDVVDIERYSQEAWAYIKSYLITAVTRRQIPSERPAYEIDEIVNLQKTDLDGSWGSLQIIAMHNRAAEELKVFEKHYPQQFNNVPKSEYGTLPVSKRFPKTTKHSRCHRIA